METVKYTYISSIDYINSLEFDYLETYSLQRGEEYEKSQKLLTDEYNSLKKVRYLNSSEGKRFTKLNELLNFTQYLINDRGEFHPSSEKINTFKQNDAIVEELKSILRTEIKQKPMLLCAPFYRDAIVFYDKNGQIISCLNICLSCNHLETKKFSHLNADWKAYDLLKQFFIDIGHNVEKPTSFLWKDYQEQVSKVLSKRKAK